MKEIKIAEGKGRKENKHMEVKAVKGRNVMDGTIKDKTAEL